MKNLMMKLAGVKTEEDFYKKYPTEESFMAKHGKALKKAQRGGLMYRDSQSITPMETLGIEPLSQIPAMDLASSPIGPETFDYGAASKGFKLPGGDNAMGYLSAGTDIVKGLSMIKGQKAAVKKAKQNSKLTGVQAYAAGLDPEEIERKYLRPEDMVQPLDSFLNPLGSGTEILAKKGKKIPKGGATRHPAVGRTQGTLINSRKKFEIGTEYRKDQMSPEEYRQWYERSSGRINPSASPIDAAVLGASGVLPLLSPITSNAPLMITGAITAPAPALNEYGRNKGKRKQDELKETLQWAPPQGEYQLGGIAEGLSSDQSQQFLNTLSNYITNDGRGQDAGSMIGGGIGGAIGTYFGGPIGAEVGKFAGRFIGGKIDTADDKVERYNKDTNKNIGSMLTPYMMSNIASNYGASMQNGGTLLGGDLQIGKEGRAVPISNNPYSPSETIMFEGPSHDEGGIDIMYGGRPVEVEREPAMKDRKDNMVIFGDIKMNDTMAAMLGDPDAKNKKMKKYVAELAERESKLTKKIENSTIKASDKDPLDKYDRLGLTSLQYSIKGSENKLKTLAEKKDRISSLQSAIDEVATQGGFDPKFLMEKGEIRTAKNGASIPIAQSGDKVGWEEKLRKSEESRRASRKEDDRRYKLYEEFKEDPSNKLPRLSFKEFNEIIYGKPTFNNWYQKKYGEEGFTPSTFRDRLWATNNPIIRAFIPNSTTKGQPSSTSTRQIDIPLDMQSSISNDGTTKPGGKGTGKTTAKSSTKTIPVATETAPETPFILNLPEREQQPLLFGEEGYTPLTIDPLANPTQRLTTEPDWFKRGVMALNSVLPYLRPSDKEELDPRNIMGELHSLATDKVEPVQAQLYHPQLRTPYDVSLQDMINQNTATFRGAERMAGYNPAALSMINAQRYGADQKVLAEQFRLNQAEKDKVYSGNIDTMNQAQMTNLGLLDNQMVRQETAKSLHKENVQNALNSISSKYLQNQMENRQLQAYENLYNYRFGDDMRADNWNPLQTFDPYSGDPSYRTAEGRETLYSKNDKGEYVEHSIVNKKKGKTSGKNGALVKAIKGL